MDYFGEKKKVRNDFYTLAPGDYVYAQGGFVIQKISRAAALPVLKDWRNIFSKLRDVDLRLTREPKGLCQTANALRRKHIGNACCVHGIIEFSNHCRNNCLYCGLRAGNRTLKRYRIPTGKIVDACSSAVNGLGFKAIVLQSGEDVWYDDAKLTDLVKRVREKCAALIVMSIGERGIRTYRKLYAAGARGVLMRFETSNSGLYEKYRPGHSLRDRIEFIKKLRAMGYAVITGFMVGLPGQTENDILNDIHLTQGLGAEMFSFGPFIPHPLTPLSGARPPDTGLMLSAIARARIIYPDSRILATSALETLDKKNGAALGLSSGANSLMINLTPEKYGRLYDIYPSRAGVSAKLGDRIEAAVKLLRSLGRAPTDVGM